MPRKAVSVTLDVMNLTWLRGRARVTSKGNLSEALDRLVTEVRTGGLTRPVRSVAGTVRLPADDPDLSKAKAAMRALFAESLARPLFAREASEPCSVTPRKAPSRAAKRGRRA